MAQSEHTKDDSMTTREAGKKGGDTTAKKGPEFYSRIGSMQGEENNPGNLANRSPEDRHKTAQAGGEARGQQMHEEAEERKNAD